MEKSKITKQFRETANKYSTYFNYYIWFATNVDFPEGVFFTKDIKDKLTKSFKNLLTIMFNILTLISEAKSFDDLDSITIKAYVRDVRRIYEIEILPLIKFNKRNTLIEGYVFNLERTIDNFIEEGRRNPSKELNKSEAMDCIIYILDHYSVLLDMIAILKEGICLDSLKDCLEEINKEFLREFGNDYVNISIIKKSLKKYEMYITDLQRKFELSEDFITKYTEKLWMLYDLYLEN